MRKLLRELAARWGQDYNLPRIEYDTEDPTVTSIEEVDWELVQSLDTLVVHVLACTVPGLTRLLDQLELSVDRKPRHFCEVAFLFVDVVIIIALEVGFCMGAPDFCGISHVGIIQRPFERATMLSKRSFDFSFQKAKDPANRATSFGSKCPNTRYLPKTGPST